MIAKKISSQATILCGLVGIQIIWSLSYILSEIITEAFPPLIWACIKSAVTAVFMVLLALLLKRPHPKPSKEFFSPLLVFAFLGGVFTQALFLAGVHYSNSINSAIINTFTPLITLLTVIYLGLEKATLPRIAGTMISFFGVLVLSHIDDFHFRDRMFFGNFLSFLGCISYGMFLALSKDFFQKYDRIWITAWIFMVSTISLPMIAYPQFLNFHWPKMTVLLWAAVFYGIFIATILGYFMVIWVVAHAPASRVALFEYFQPLLCSLLAWFFLNEKLTLRALAAGSMIFLGVALSNRNREMEIKEVLKSE